MRLFLFWLIAVLTLSVPVAASAEVASSGMRQPSAAPIDFALPNGHFYKQANGQGGAGETGYPVVNAAIFTGGNVRLFDEFVRSGGVPLVGFPASRSFVLDGFITEVFQKAVFQWRPEVDEVFFVNVFDVLHDRGFDPFLQSVRQVPPQLPTSFDAGKTVQQIVNDRLALLNANAAIRGVYFSVDDPLLRFGLPTSAVTDFGNVFVIRLQRAVLQQWKVAVPWAAAGQVTIANGGDVFKELNQIPSFAAAPLPTPSFSRNIVIYLPGAGSTVNSPITLFGDAQVFEAVVSFQLLGASGNVLASGNPMTAAGGPLFGRFQVSVPFSLSAPQAGTLRVFENSAKDGLPIPDTIVSIPLTLIP